MSAFIPLVPNSGALSSSFTVFVKSAKSTTYSVSRTCVRSSPTARVFQSPIDIPKKGNTQDYFDYAPTLEERNTHMKFLVEPHGENFHMESTGTAGSTGYIASVITNGIRFELDQVHMHSPSENHLEGKEQDLEIHLVHSCGPLLCVLGILFEIDGEDKANAELGKLIKAMEKKRENPRKEVDIDIHIGELIENPARHQLLRFTGSLTTPPYSEGVIWVVSTKIVKCSKKQVEAYKKLIGNRNDRPIQPLNNRPIISFTSGD